jgi:hypothetical protein
LLFILQMPRRPVLAFNKSSSQSVGRLATTGVETVYPDQMTLAASAREMMGDRNSLRVLADELSDDLVAEVLDFAEFLKLKRQCQISAEG